MSLNNILEKLIFSGFWVLILKEWVKLSRVSAGIDNIAVRPVCKQN